MGAYGVFVIARAGSAATGAVPEPATMSMIGLPIGDAAVLLAAAGVFGTGSGLPDVVVAAVMGTLALTASVSVIAKSRRELAGP